MKDIAQIIEQLKAPFPFKDVSARIQYTNNDKTQGFAVFYIDSRAIQSRLDSVVGPFNWHNEYMLWQDKSQLCGISIYDETRNIWVTKYDGAENSSIEPIKGGLSDSMKRAAVMWGLGRYLYDVDGVWVGIEKRGKNDFIKSSETPKLEAHYNRCVFAKHPVANGQGQQPSMPAPQMNMAGQQRQAAPQPNINQQNPAAPQAANQPPYDYRIINANVSGNSACLTLCDRQGKQIQAYAKKDSPGLVPGTLIKNVNMRQENAPFGSYYKLDNYELAA